MTTEQKDGGCIRGAALATVMLALLVAWDGSGRAQGGDRRIVPIGVEANRAEEDLACSLRLERFDQSRGRVQVQSGGDVSVGDRVVICLNASTDGYVTVWSRDAESTRPSRIYPNEYGETAGQMGARLVGGEEVCLGDDENFILQVTRPLGESEVYLHFTRDETEQFPEDAFPQPGRVGGNTSPDSSRDWLARSVRYSSSHLRYQVVE